MGLRLNNSSVYMQSHPCYAITMIIAINNLTQLDVLEKHQRLLILALDWAAIRAGAASHCLLGPFNRTGADTIIANAGVQVDDLCPYPARGVVCSLGQTRRHGWPENRVKTPPRAQLISWRFS